MQNGECLHEKNKQKTINYWQDTTPMADLLTPEVKGIKPAKVSKQKPPHSKTKIVVYFNTGNLICICHHLPCPSVTK